VWLRPKTTGATWTEQAGLTATAWGAETARSVIWTGSMLVVGGNDGSIATSPDGVTWTYQDGLKVTAWGENTVLSLAWTGSVLVAGGYDDRVATSPDGVVWTYRPGLASLGGGGLAIGAIWSMAWFNSMILAFGMGNYATSPDGVTWTKSSLAFLGMHPHVTHGSALFIGGSYGEVAYSTDGVTWTRIADIGDVAQVSAMASSGTLVLACNHAQKVAVCAPEVTP